MFYFCWCLNGLRILSICQTESAIVVCSAKLVQWMVVCGVCGIEGARCQAPVFCIDGFDGIHNGPTETNGDMEF